MFSRLLTCLMLALVLSCHAAEAPAEAAPATPSSTKSDYLIGPGDTVKVTVYGNADLSSEVRVRQNGDIRLPLIEQVHVDGLTIEQLEDLVRVRLRDGNFVKDARVLATISEYRSRRVAVLGFVAKPGLYSLEHPSHVSDLLAMAGGVEAQGADQVIIQKADARAHPLTYDVGRALIEGHGESDILLDAGDTVFVPKAALYFIEGEITKAGAYRVERNLSVQQAMANAGGVGPRGCERMVSIKRRADKGQPEERSARLDELVQPDDVLTLQPCLLYIYGEVQKPGIYRLEEGLTMQQALVLGGGATIRGNIKSLRVNRRSADGKVHELDDVAPSEAVLPNDVIYVKERLF